MMHALKNLRPLTLALALASVAIACWIAQRAWMGTQADALLATPARQYTATQVDLNTPPLKTSLEPIRDQALFHVTRAFYVAPPPPAAPLTPPRPSYLLAGTFIIPRKPTVALLTQAGGGASRKVRPGDDLDGWRVQSVETDRVVLDYNGERMEIARDGGVASTGLTRAPLNVAASTPRSQVRVLGDSTSSRGSLREASAAPTDPRVEARLYRPPPQ